MNLPSISKCLYRLYLSIVASKVRDDRKTLFLNGFVAINRAVSLPACDLENCCTIGSVTKYSVHHFPPHSYQIHVVAQVIISLSMNKLSAG